LSVIVLAQSPQAVVPSRKSGKLSEFKYPQWQVPLREAVLEFDVERLSIKVQTADKAIRDRLHELTSDTFDFQEQQALKDALATLEILRRREQR
jgi:hypothetical protein